MTQNAPQRIPASLRNSADSLHGNGSMLVTGPVYRLVEKTVLSFVER